ncbi:S8 family serine peptidase [Halovivax limisalsi]|uniref:S8 family serine peptidase n=1 Tax=Halovivax limisalsi TaxID=1453760 RepID=UPI001FFD17EC|nr:S8 family serine peptidase [Halovivax limisalsi]
MGEDDRHGFDRRSVLKAAGAVGATVSLGGVTVATPGREPGPKEDEIVVGTNDGVSIKRARATIESTIPNDAAVVHENDVLDYAAVKLSDDSAGAMRTVIDQLERQPDVAYAERNETWHAFAEEPNDPRFSDQYAPQLVNAPTAWDTEMGSMDVTIAVIDTGADYTHPDISDRFGENKGYDFVDGDGDPAPVGGRMHGTHVSGCAAATTGNNEGVAGISNCHLISGRVLGPNGGSVTDIADGIQWAADQGADIINLSLGGGGGSETGRSAINYAYNNGTLPIAAAGNDGGPVSYPAAYQNCLAVSAIDESENLASFSNRGPEINVASPGVDVLSSVPDGGYDTASGTSMASPVAAGVAALGKSAHPDLSAQELWDKLEETAVDIGLPEDHQGSGRVDAANIVEGGGGECSGETETTTESGYLAWWNDREDYTYATTTDSPCGIDIELEGPGSFANYDLYVTYDGRTPTTGDYDDRSAGSGPDEAISGSLSGTTDVGVLVHAAEGWGNYDLTITEQGQS